MKFVHLFDKVNSGWSENKTQLAYLTHGPKGL